MKSYRVKATILLSFHDGREQSDAYITPEATDHLEVNEDTIYVISKNGMRLESITTVNVVDAFTRSGHIEEITADSPSNQ